MKVACWDVHPDTWIPKLPRPPPSQPCLPSSTEFTLNLGYSAPDPARQQGQAGQAWASQDFGVEPSEGTSQQW